MEPTPQAQRSALSRRNSRRHWLGHCHGSRARELASAVSTVRRLTQARPVRLLCYSAGGVAARLWMQDGLSERPYETGSVRHLVTIGTPHSGIGGAARWVPAVWKRYASLSTDSPLLRRINDELELPPDVRYTAIVLQGSGPGWGDTGRNCRLALSDERVARLPPLLRTGHDGVVHSLSAQLHLTPTAARYEIQGDCVRA